MPREVIWLREALLDLARLHEFAKQKRPAAATRLTTRIREAVKVLRNHPDAGLQVEYLPEYRDLIIPYKKENFVVRYRHENGTIFITQSKHNREEDF